MSMTTIRIVEVGPRDGLQNEPAIVSVEKRVELINLLSECGFAEIEVGSFVSPKWIPQLVNTDQVYEQIQKHPKCRYSALVPNERGMNDALSVGMNCVSIFTAASETFSQKNTNCSIDESFERFKPVMTLAIEKGVRVRGYVSTAITCPFEGDIDPEAVAEVAYRLSEIGCAEISLGDTIGKGTPKTINAMVEAVKTRVPVEKLAIHCHDTYGNAVDNVLEALACGIRLVDSAIHGLGGCPYAVVKEGERAKGNVATEKVIEALLKEGYLTTVDLHSLERASTYVSNLMSKINS
jgi:hydroxymethylglutaryl-CoA lyase